MSIEMKETKRAKGVSLICYCGAKTFVLSTLGKLGYMAVCSECDKRFEMVEVRDGEIRPL